MVGVGVGKFFFHFRSSSDGIIYYTLRVRSAKSVLFLRSYFTREQDVRGIIEPGRFGRRVLPPFVAWAIHYYDDHRRSSVTDVDRLPAAGWRTTNLRVAGGPFGYGRSRRRHRSHRRRCSSKTR